ncbi:unnamed protein product, partial [Heterotrigona itama]
KFERSRENIQKLRGERRVEEMASRWQSRSSTDSHYRDRTGDRMVMPNGPALPYPDPIMQIGNSHLATLLAGEEAEVVFTAGGTSISGWTDEILFLLGPRASIPVFVSSQRENFERPLAPSLIFAKLNFPAETIFFYCEAVCLIF